MWRSLLPDSDEKSHFPSEFSEKGFSGGGVCVERQLAVALTRGFLTRELGCGTLQRKRAEGMTCSRGAADTTPASALGRETGRF